MAFTRGLPKKSKRPMQGRGRGAGQADERKARKTERTLNNIRDTFKSRATPMLGMKEGGVMKTKGMKKGGMMKSKGYAKGGAMKTKGMAKGGAMKTKGGVKGGMNRKMRAPSSKKSGLFGR
jgi:hypothetical protein|tara:strand:+ start:479 stop:841 length:363 start_codon:yes stop_codon:yes gene_type:complete